MPDLVDMMGVYDIEGRASIDSDIYLNDILGALAHVEAVAGDIDTYSSNKEFTRSVAQMCNPIRKAPDNMIEYPGWKFVCEKDEKSDAAKRFDLFKDAFNRDMQNVVDIMMFPEVGKYVKHAINQKLDVPSVVHVLHQLLDNTSFGGNFYGLYHHPMVYAVHKSSGVSIRYEFARGELTTLSECRKINYCEIRAWIDTFAWFEIDLSRTIFHKDSSLADSDDENASSVTYKEYPALKRRKCALFNTSMVFRAMKEYFTGRV